MKAILRSWRSLVLAWAVVLAPHAALVHALSHDAGGASAHRQESDTRGHAANQPCGTCLAFAQLGAALPSRFEMLDAAQVETSVVVAPAIAAISRHVAAFDARAPPAPLT